MPPSSAMPTARGNPRGRPAAHAVLPACALQILAVGLPESSLPGSRAASAHFASLSAPRGATPTPLTAPQHTLPP